MPVVSLSYERLSRMVGAPAGEVRRSLPFLGLDIEHEQGDTVRIEYSPNRPDYSTEYGVALGLRGMLDIETGIYPARISAAGWRLEADESVRTVRPAITGMVARERGLDACDIKQIIAMQEDLHEGLGRKRRKLAIGLHDLDKMSFPLRYTTVTREFEFPPLGQAEPMPVHRILSETDQGVRYGPLLFGDRIPVILDSEDRVASMPPVINSSHTTVTEGTRNLLVDITGGAIPDIENALAVVCVTLQAAGFALERLEVSGAGNRTPELATREMSIDHAAPNRMIGLEMTAEETAGCLRRSRLDARVDGDTIRCTVPAYRFDMFGPMDIVEEVALGYGVDNMEPTIPGVRTVGQPSRLSARLGCIGRVMTGLGFTEAVNSSLIGSEIISRAGGSASQEARRITVAGSKSQSHTTLRHALIPRLLENLSGNIHEPYPHRLYETGTVFERTDEDFVAEPVHLGCVTAHQGASYSEAKSVLKSVLGAGGPAAEVRTPPVDEAPFRRGRAAAVEVGGARVGIVGEISGEVCRAFRIREGVSVAAFEIDVS